MEKSSKKIEIIFNECLDCVLTGQTTLEQCLEKYPAQAAELEPLLRTALAINSAAAVQPDPQAKARGRYQLQLKMAQIGKPRRAPIFGWQPRWAVAVVTVMLVFTLGGGTVLAADNSMPGNPLYPVKIATENVRIQLAGSKIEKEALLATSADRRVAEIAHVVAKGNVNAKVVQSIAARYIKQVDEMSGMMAGQVQPMVTSGVGTMTTEGTTPSVASQPETTTPPLLGASPNPTETTEPAQAVSRQDQQTENLKNTIIAYAITHPDQIQKLLDNPNVPEQAKPALRRMLQDAKEKYPQAVKDLERQQQAPGKGSSQGNND
jgi:hypothetical protein